MWASWYFRQGDPQGLQVGRGSERHVFLESALIWGLPAHLTFSSGGRDIASGSPPGPVVLRSMSAPGRCAQLRGRGRRSPSPTAASGSFCGQSPQPQLSPHEESEVAGSRDLRGRPDARAAGKPGGGSGASGSARLSVREAGAMGRR